MKKSAIKIRNYASSVSVVSSNDARRRTFFFLLFTLAGLGVLYCLILGLTVFNIAERRNMEAQARAFSSEVAELELRYLSLTKQIDPVFSKDLGFREAKAKFVSRTPAGYAQASGEGTAFTGNEI